MKHRFFHNNFQYDNNNNNKISYERGKQRGKRDNKSLRFVMHNNNGGLYSPGRSHDIVTKSRVADVYIQLLHQLFPRDAPVTMVAKYANVSWTFANKVIQEVRLYGDVVDPEDLANEKACRKPILMTEDEMCIISLYIEDPGRNKLDYVSQLFLHNGT